MSYVGKVSALFGVQDVSLSRQDVSLSVLDDIQNLRKSVTKHDYKDAIATAMLALRQRQNILIASVEKGQDALNKVKGLGLDSVEAEIKRYMQLSKEDISLYKSLEAKLAQVK